MKKFYFVVLLTSLVTWATVSVFFPEMTNLLHSGMLVGMGFLGGIIAVIVTLI